MGVSITVLILCCLMSFSQAIKFNYTCKFKLPDNEIYNMESLRNSKAPDYTYKEGEHLYIVNFCGPSIKRCAGIEGSSVSLWNSTSFDCIVTAAENDPEAVYINDRNVFNGISIKYKHGMSFTTINIQCDQAYDKAVFVKAVREHAGYELTFKSKLVCRNYAIPVTDHWSAAAVFLVSILFAILIYIGCGLLINLRGGSYNGIADIFPNRECFLRFALKLKEIVNNIIGETKETVEDKQNTSLPAQH